MKLSVIIPSDNDPYLQNTVDSLLAASGLGFDLEVIAVLDGIEQKVNGANVVKLDSKQGMRGAINAGLSEAKGDFVMKVDAHCAFGKGFDKVMVESCKEDWLVIPRRYSLHELAWGANMRKAARDYHFLSYPTEEYGFTMTPQDWHKDGEAGMDDTMSFQGSCWLANRGFFMETVGLLDDRLETYGSFAAEQLEIGLKYWLTGGQVKVNKNTWYAHLCKMPRHYNSGDYVKKPNFKRGWVWAARHWLNDEEPGMALPFAWLVEKFWPVPTWPEDRGLWRLDEAA